MGQPDRQERTDQEANSPDRRDDAERPRADAQLPHDGEHEDGLEHGVEDIREGTTPDEGSQAGLSERLPQPQSSFLPDAMPLPCSGCRLGRPDTGEQQCGGEVRTGIGDDGERGGAP